MSFSSITFKIRRMSPEEIREAFKDLEGREARRPVERVLKIVCGRGALEEFDRILREEMTSNPDGSFSFLEPPQ